LLTTPIVRPDGAEIIAEIRPTAVVQEGRIVGTRGVIRDVTERVRADDALRLSDSILNRIGNLVLVADADGMITYVSSSVENLLGYRAEEIIGDGWWRLAWTDADAAEQERGTVARRVRGEEPLESDPRERSVRARDGTTHWILWNESSGPEGFLIGVGHDITERKVLQEQFLQAQKMEAVGRLAGGIAHDFNNVLTSILITTDLLLPELAEDDATHADVVTIRGAAQRAAALTQQLLAFSRKQVLKPKVVSLNGLVGDMEGMLRSLLGEDIAIEALLAPDLGNVEMDPGQMQQVIMNLAVNARDAMPRGGRLVMETRNVELNGEYVRSHAEARPGPFVLLSVTDNGLGMDPAVMEHIFEPFFTTKGVGKGTGLGLATVHGIVNQSGGHIWVYSEPGRGTTFKIYLPRVHTALDPSVAASPGSPRMAEGAETILVVEDDDPVRKATERVLRRAGYQVVGVNSGAEALAAMEAREDPIHLMITDVVMPGMTGPDLAERLLADLPGLRVIFVSGYTDEMVARQGLLGAGRHFLEKPFSIDVLLDRVREVLDGSTPTLPDPPESELE
jgi:PAS domain S-box-containing protein